ncbi:ammonium transporter [Nitrospira sp. Nam80]
MISERDHTLWLVMSTTLVMLTFPGVALFYGGMVRKKNVLNTMAMIFLALVLASIEWLLWGERIAVGSYETAATGMESGRPSRALHHALSGALALALVSGTLVERVRFMFFLLFGLVWVGAVYGPIAHWLWGGGWLTNMGSLDFAGGAVIHLSAGVSALVAALVIGPRRGYGRIEMIPNHLPFAVCGAGLMWVGWCGFSAGPSPSSMNTATSALVAIHAAAAASALTWTLAEWMQRDKPTALGTVSGAVAGLVASSSAAGYVGPLAAIVIGIGAGALSYMVVNYVKLILGYDDSLDVFGMHGVAGAWSMIATGLFASTAVNPDGSDGLFNGYPYQLFAQVVAMLAVALFAAGMTFVVITVLRMVLVPRVEEEAESMGLDLTQHGEKGYS